MIKSRQTNNNISAQKIFNHLTFWRRKMQFSKNFENFIEIGRLKNLRKSLYLQIFGTKSIFMSVIWTFLNENELISTQNGFIMT